MTWPSGDPAYSAPQPPPMPYQRPHDQGPYGQPQGPRTPQKKSHRGALIAVIVGFVVLGVVAALVVLRYQQKQNTLTDLKVGDCIADVPNGELVSAAIPTVDCGQPHAGEVYAVLSIPGTDYPGQATITEWQNKCPAELKSYASAPTPDDTLKVFVLYPTEQTWGQGDHAVTCVATTTDKRTGSLKG